MLNIYLKKIDKFLIISILFLIVVTGILSKLFLEEFYVVITIAFTVLIVLTLIFDIYRKLLRKIENLSKKNESNYRQIEDLFSIYFSLSPEKPLPNMRTWAASPDFLKQILLHIEENNVENIIIDDANRTSEMKMVKKWVEMYENVSYKFIPTDKGLCVLSIN